MARQNSRFDTPQPHEPMFNVPLPVLLIALSMPVLFFFQQQLPDMGGSMAFAPADLEQGRWGGLFTSMLLHANWPHALMNAVAAVAFGAPVARLFGDRIGPSVFLLFYVSCGALAALGYGLIHWGSPNPMVGASGAVFGLIGAATRLLGAHGRVRPLFDKRVIAMSLAWMAVNLFTGVVGYARRRRRADRLGGPCGRVRGRHSGHRPAGAAVQARRADRGRNRLIAGPQSWRAGRFDFVRRLSDHPG
jgi:membrane associated rhomboid family serine protease